MPTSQSSQIYEIISFVSYFDFRRILDVGVGFGQYAFMLRNRVARTFDLSAMTIDGIEGYAEYVTDLHHLLYNRIYIERAEQIIPRLPERAYELALLIDVIEHLETPLAREVVSQLRRIAAVVLVSTPAEWMEQRDEANPLENHVSLWTKRSLKQLGATAFLPNEQSHLAVFAGPEYVERVHDYAMRRWRWAYVPIPLRRHVLALRSLLGRRRSQGIIPFRRDKCP